MSAHVTDVLDMLRENDWVWFSWNFRATCPGDLEISRTSSIPKPRDYGAFIKAAKRALDLLKVNREHRLIDTVTRELWSMLRTPCQDLVPIVAILGKFNPDLLNEPLVGQDTALIIAILQSNEAMVAALLKQKVNIFKRGNLYKTPLEVAESMASGHAVEREAPSNSQQVSKIIEMLRWHELRLLQQQLIEVLPRGSLTLEEIQKRINEHVQNLMISSIQAGDLVSCRELLIAAPKVLIEHIPTAALPDTVLKLALDKQQFKIAWTLLQYPINVQCISFNRISALSLIERQLKAVVLAQYDKQIELRGIDPDIASDTRVVKQKELDGLTHQKQQLQRLAALVLEKEQAQLDQGTSVAQCLVRLKLAAIDGNLTQVSEILDRYPNIINTALDDQGATVLMLAARYARVELVQLLLDRTPRADVLVKRPDGQTALLLVDWAERYLCHTNAIVPLTATDAERNAAREAAAAEKVRYRAIKTLLGPAITERELEQAIIEGDLASVTTLLEEHPQLLNQRIGLRWLTPLDIASSQKLDETQPNHDLVLHNLLGRDARCSDGTSITMPVIEFSDAEFLSTMQAVKQPHAVHRLYQSYREEMDNLAMQTDALSRLKLEILKLIFITMACVDYLCSIESTMDLWCLLNLLLTEIQRAQTIAELKTNVKERLAQREMSIRGTRMEYSYSDERRTKFGLVINTETKLPNLICLKIINRLFPTEPALQLLLPSGFPPGWCRLNGDTTIPQYNEQIFRASNGKIYVLADVIDYAVAKLQTTCLKLQEIWPELSDEDISTLNKSSEAFKCLYRYSVLLVVHHNKQSHGKQLWELIYALDAANAGVGDIVERQKEALIEDINKPVATAVILNVAFEKFKAALNRAQIAIRTQTLIAYSDYLSVLSSDNLEQIAAAKKALIEALEAERLRAGADDRMGEAGVLGLARFNTYWDALPLQLQLELRALKHPDYALTLGENLDILNPQERYRIVTLAALPTDLSIYKYKYLYIATEGVAPQLYYIQTHGSAETLSAVVVPITNFTLFSQTLNELRIKYALPVGQASIELNAADARTLITANGGYELRGGLRVNLRNTGQTTTCAYIRGLALRDILNHPTVKSKLQPDEPASIGAAKRHISTWQTVAKTMQLALPFELVRPTGFLMESQMVKPDYAAISRANKLLQQSRQIAALWKNLQGYATQHQYRDHILRFIFEQTDNQILDIVIDALRHPSFDRHFRQFDRWTLCSTTLHGKKNVSTSESWLIIEGAYRLKRAQNQRSATRASATAHHSAAAKSTLKDYFSSDCFFALFKSDRSSKAAQVIQDATKSYTSPGVNILQIHDGLASLPEREAPSIMYPLF